MALVIGSCNTSTDFQSSSKELNCCPDPDTAGGGIVLSFLIAAWITAILSIVLLFGHDKTAWILENIPVERAYNLRGRLSLRVSKNLAIVLSGLDITQFVTGSSMLVLVSVYYRYPAKVYDMHAYLAFQLSALAISSQSMSVMALGSTGSLHRGALSVRLVVGLAQNVATIVIIAARYFGDMFVWSQVETIAVLNLGFRLTYGFLYLVRGRKILTPGHGYAYFAAGLLYGIVTTLWSSYSVVWTKYYKRNNCDMRQSDDNAWTLGQSLAILLLASILVSIGDAMLEARHDARKAKMQHDNRSANPLANVASPSPVQMTVVGSTIAAVVTSPAVAHLPAPFMAAGSMV